MDDVAFLTGGEQLLLDSIEFPQANNLTKVFRVADLVATGASSTEEIAEGLNLVAREGSYYASAACAVRMVRKQPSYVGTFVDLTEMGQDFVDGDEARRRWLTVHWTLDCPHVKFVAHRLGLALPLKPPVDGLLLDQDKVGEALREFHDLGAATRARRAASLTSWMTRVNALHLP